MDLCLHIKIKRWFNYHSIPSNLRFGKMQNETETSKIYGLIKSMERHKSNETETIKVIYENHFFGN